MNASFRDAAFRLERSAPRDVPVGWEETGEQIARLVVSETGAEVVMRSDGLHTLVGELDDREERISSDG
jgi:hypothetical protein